MHDRPHPADGGVDTDVLDGETLPPKDERCVDYERCGNIVPENGRMCGPCLDNARERSRKNERVAPQE